MSSISTPALTMLLVFTAITGNVHPLPTGKSGNSFFAINGALLERDGQ